VLASGVKTCEFAGLFSMTEETAEKLSSGAKAHYLRVFTPGLKLRPPKETSFFRKL